MKNIICDFIVICGYGSLMFLLGDYYATKDLKPRGWTCQAIETEDGSSMCRVDLIDPPTSYYSTLSCEKVPECIGRDWHLEQAKAQL